MNNSQTKTKKRKRKTTQMNNSQSKSKKPKTKSKRRKKTTQDANLKVRRPKPGNSFADKNPDKVCEWHPTLNGKWKPEDFCANSNIYATWICQVCKNSWQTIFKSRTNGHGCPECGKRKRNQKNSYCTREESFAVNPDYKYLLEEWDFKENKRSPFSVRPGSKYKASWKCKKCGHKWKAMVQHRTNGQGCPECGIKKRALTQSICTREESFAVFPEYKYLLEEWDDDRSKFTVKPGSHYKASWRCKKCGHKWNSMVLGRTNGKGCPSIVTGKHCK